MSIPLKLNRGLGHGLKMCILFGYYPQIISIDERAVARSCVFSQAPEFQLLDFFCSRIQFYVLLSHYLCFISFSLICMYLEMVHR